MRPVTRLSQMRISCSENGRSPKAQPKCALGLRCWINPRLVIRTRGRMLGDVNGKWSKWLPYVFMLVAALSRWPKLFPPNFSAFYGLAFCAGAFFPRNVKWWLPLGTLVVTDIALDVYYHSFSVMQLVNYAAFALIILFGTRFNHRSRFLGLLAGGIVGAFPNPCRSSATKGATSSLKNGRYW